MLDGRIKHDDTLKHLSHHAHPIISTRNLSCSFTSIIISVVSHIIVIVILIMIICQAMC